MLKELFKLFLLYLCINTSIKDFNVFILLHTCMIMMFLLTFIQVGCT
jgi:hypothetical protein